MSTFEATSVQVQLFDAARDGRFRFIGFGGGIRGTKTWGGLGMLITLCRLFPRSRWAVVRKDLPTLRRNTVPSFNKLREEYFGSFIGEINQSEWTATCTNGSQLIFFSESLDIDPDLSRWKGLEVNGFLLEEADELAEKSFHKAIERSGAWIVPNQGTQPPPYVFCTFNPCANWPKHVFYEPWKNGTIAAPYAFIPATAADNPFVPEATREAWKSLPDQEYRRFVEGDWDVLSGRYYDGLDARVHFIQPDQMPDPLPAWWEYWGGYDWGYAHWAVMGAFARDTEGTTYLLDSHWVRRHQDADQAAAFKHALPERCFGIVYAGTDCWSKVTARGGTGVTTFEVFAAERINLIQADTDKANGGRVLRRALHFRRDDAGIITQPPALYLVDTPGNRRLFSQLSEIMPDETDVNKPGKVDADSEGRGGDDGADMLRYGICSRLTAKSAPPAAWSRDIHPGIDASGKRKDAGQHVAPSLSKLMQREVPAGRPGWRMPVQGGRKRVEV